MIVEPDGYVEAPVDYTGAGPSIFLAGGITHCPDWQATAVRMLAGGPAVVLNPRRSRFDVGDPSVAEEQIRWEYGHLQLASVVLFWFAESPSPQPIALYELGAMAAADRRMAVGAHPRYSRRTDVVLQLALARPDLTVHADLAATVTAAVAGL